MMTDTYFVRGTLKHGGGISQDQLKHVHNFVSGTLDEMPVPGFEFNYGHIRDARVTIDPNSIKPNIKLLKDGNVRLLLPELLLLVNAKDFEIKTSLIQFQGEIKISFKEVCLAIEGKLGGDPKITLDIRQESVGIEIISQDLGARVLAPIVEVIRRYFVDNIIKMLKELMEDNAKDLLKQMLN